MVKTIIKETFIMLLLCIAIILILGILFYDYIPTNRVIPTKEAYSTPENVKEEINEQITEMEKTEVSYEITDSDLNIYKQTSSYKPGKKDPFHTEPENIVNENNNNASENRVNNGNDEKEETNNDTTSDTNDNSTNTFFDDEGIK